MESQKSTNIQAFSGSLIGVVLDLSGSMQSSMNNQDRRQSSRIENLSRAFTTVISDAKALSERVSIADKTPYLRLFIHGFGIISHGNEQTVQDSIGDVLSIIRNIDEHIEAYQLLRLALEKLWTDEIANSLEKTRVVSDAKSELCQFVERELREQAIQAEQQRSVARFQRWCASVCQKLDVFGTELRRRATKNKRLTFILLPLTLLLLCLLKGPAWLLSFLNQSFENWLQKTLTNLRNNASTIATQQSNKVVEKTTEALNKSHDKISQTIEQEFSNFIDGEAFKLIHLYNNRSNIKTVMKAFDKNMLKQVYSSISAKIIQIMEPHANSSWKASMILFKTAARALRIKPNWEQLKSKTILCAYQVAWEILSPEIKEKARILAKERFTRAALIDITRKTKDKRTTLTLGELSTLVKCSEQVHLSVNELPIFGESPLGTTLLQTFERLLQESQLQKNEGLRPAIVIISDGIPTDIDPSLLAGKIKSYGIPIVCCFVTNRNVGQPWLLPQRMKWFWPRAAKLMFSLSSSVDEWPEFREKLQESRFLLKKQSKLFIQINHAEYLQNFIEAVLLPIDKEMAQFEAVQSG